MADRGDEFSFFQGTHVRIDSSISLRPMITKFGKQVHLQNVNQMKLTKPVLATSFRQDHVKN